MNRLTVIVLVALGFAYWAYSSEPDAAPLVEPRRVVAAESGKSVEAGRSYNGEDLTVDLPGSLHIKNIGHKIDGLGMCVTTSIEMQALSLGMEEFRGFRDWCAKDRTGGGGYPSKVDDLIKRYCAEKGIPVPRYIQVEGRSSELAAAIELLDKTGRDFCCTYGYSPRYGGGDIAHMVFAVKYNGEYGVVLDNNFIGETRYEWQPRAELMKRICHPSGQGWIFSWLGPASVNKPLRN